MRDDSNLLFVVFAVWGVLATLYATVPMFAMPGSALVWGGGSFLFLVLALLVRGAERRGAADQGG